MVVVRPAPRFRGRLVDQSGGACSGVDVGVMGASGTVLTDADGRFTLRGAREPIFLAVAQSTRGFEARVDIAGAADGLTAATVTVDAPWLRLRTEGLRHLP